MQNPLKTDKSPAMIGNTIFVDFCSEEHLVLGKEKMLVASGVMYEASGATELNLRNILAIKSEKGRSDAIQSIEHLITIGELSMQSVCVFTTKGDAMMLGQAGLCPEDMLPDLARSPSDEIYHGVLQIIEKMSADAKIQSNPKAMLSTAGTHQLAYAIASFLLINYSTTHGRKVDLLLDTPPGGERTLIQFNAINNLLGDQVRALFSARHNVDISLNATSNKGADKPVGIMLADFMAYSAVRSGTLEESTHTEIERCESTPDTKWEFNQFINRLMKKECVLMLPLGRLLYVYDTNPRNTARVRQAQKKHGVGWMSHVLWDREV